MANSVTFLNDPLVTAVGHGPGEEQPVAYVVDASLSFPSGAYEQDSVSLSTSEDGKVVIQLNVNTVQGNGPSMLNFREDFAHTCLQQSQLEIVVHDGQTVLGKTGGTHQEDCEEVLRPIPTDL